MACPEEQPWLDLIARNLADSHLHHFWYDEENSISSCKIVQGKHVSCPERDLPSPKRLIRKA